jgi:hypothetical protein
MPTIEEMDDHIAYMDAWLTKCRRDSIAEITEELRTERNPYFRESLENHLVRLREAERDAERHREEHQARQAAWARLLERRQGGCDRESSGS